jgi:hypothetical protein
VPEGYGGNFLAHIPMKCFDEAIGTLYWGQGTVLLSVLAFAQINRGARSMAKSAICPKPHATLRVIPAAPNIKRRKRPGARTSGPSAMQ